VKYLVTGSVGYIGDFVSERLCVLGHEVIGLDNLNDYQINVPEPIDSRIA